MEQEEKLKKNHTDEDLKKIAIDMYEGRIFCDRHVQHSEDLKMVFMPIAMGAFAESTEEELNDIGMIYEYLSEAGPRSTNGMPNFFSLKILSKNETKTVFEHYDTYKQLKEDFLNNGQRQ